MKEMRRIISSWVVFCMLFSMLPMHVFASGEDLGNDSAETAVGSCGDDLTWEFDSATGTLTISGTGAMDNTWWPYEMPEEEPNFAPWHAYAEDIRSVVINDGAAGIGHFAFFDCVNLTSVSIPESVTFVGCAFIGCDSLQELHIPASVTDFRYPTNEGICTGLEKIVVDADNANYCSDQTGMLYNKDKTKFIGCPTGYQGSYRIADSVTEIGGWAFTECTGLTSVELPASLRTIGMSAFYGCNGLKELEISDGVATIEATAFADCTGLTNLVLPASVTTLGQMAFANCTALSEIHFEGNAPDFSYDCFYGTELTAYYPAMDETWTEAKKENYGGSVTWVPDGEEEGTEDEGFKTVNETVYAVSAANVRSGPETHYEKLGTLNVGDSVTRTGVSESGWSRILYKEQVAYVSSQYLSLTMPHTHKHTAEVTAPTCFEQGYTTYSCECGDSYVDNYVDATGHSFGEWYEIESPTQEVPCLERRDCINCESYQTRLVPQPPDEADMTGICGENLVWTLSDNILTVSGTGPMDNYGSFTSAPWDIYKSSITSVVIEEGVTVIASSAFDECTQLKYLYIPESISAIGERAFFGCTALEKIDFSAKAMNDLNYDSYVFYFAGIEGNGLTLTIGNEVSRIPKYLFYGQASFPASIGKLPNNLKEIVWESNSTCESIGESAFKLCTELDSIEFPESVNAIGMSAFEGCQALQRVYIPEQISTIGGYAFDGCTNLIEIGFYPTDVSLVNAYGENVYAGIFDNAGTAASGITVTIGSNVTQIPNYTFSGGRNESKIVKVIFEENSVCNSIGSDAFHWCRSLERINIPNSVTSIGSDAFSGCAALESVIIPSSVTQMGNNVFDNCPKLISAGAVGSGCNIEFGWDSEIPNGAFYGCSMLQKIDIPEGVTKIGYSAFANAAMLISVTIPGSVASIAEDAFSKCELLKSAGPLGSGCNITFGWEKYIPEKAFINCNTLETLIIPENIVTIGESAFENCKKLVEINFNAIAMPDNKNSDIFMKAGSEGNGITLLIGAKVTRIPGNLFAYGDYDDVNLKILEFASNSACTEIPRGAFTNCSNLTTITIPESIRQIGTYAFSQCPNIMQINFNAIAANDMEEAFSGAGSSKTKLIIGKQVTTIPAYVCRGSKISEVIFEDNSNCKNIGSGAFIACENLVRIRIPESIIEIGVNAFGTDGGIEYGKSGLISAGPVGGGYSIEFPWTDEMLPNAFSGCSSLKEVHIPETITKIGANAFSGCGELTSITIPENVVSLGEKAFNNCWNLEEIFFYPTLMNDLEIDSKVFHCASGFLNASVKLVIGHNVTRIPAFLFGTADSNLGVNPSPSHGVEITEIYFEKNSVCESIGEYAFYRCDKISDVYYGSTEEDWRGINIANGNGHLRNAEIHFNSFGSEEGDGSGDGVQDENQYAYIHYFYSWDKDNQIAYFDSDPEENPFNFGSQVTEETDTSFLANVQDLIGTYVLAETKVRDDGMFLPDTILSIKPLITKTGVITSVDEYITIDGIEYEFDLIGLHIFEENDYVMYHLYNDVIVSVTVLRPYRKPDSGGSNNWTDYPEFDYDTPPYDPSNEEKLLELYAEEWMKKYDEYILAVKEQFEAMAGSEEAIRAATIKAEADRMKVEDSRSGYSKFITFTDKSCPYKTEAYTALATLLYDEGADQFDFGKEDVDGVLIDSIMRSLYGSKKTIEYGNVEVYINILQAGNSKFGNLKCTNTRTNKTYDAVICSTQDEISDTVSSFCDELEQLANNSKINVYKAIAEDILDVELSSLEPENIADKVEEIAKEFLVKPLDLLKDIGVGQLFDTIEKCYNYFTDVEENARRADKEELEKLTIEKKQIDFDETGASWKVKRKLRALKNAAEDLNKLIDEYLSGKLEVSDAELYWKSTFKCPVSVAVYSSDGTQFGYVSEEECWYDSPIRIEKNGSEKIVYSFTEDPLSFKVTANDYGSMNCSFEEYGGNSTPIGRLNFYDIALVPDQEFTTALEENLLAQSKLMSVTTGNKAILADEYVSSDDFASVNISCTSEADDGSIGGLLLGAGTFAKGDTVTLRAVPEAGYEFAGWYAEDTLVSEASIYVFTAREDLTLTAKFVVADYVYLDILAEGNGTVSGAGEYHADETVKIWAEPGENFEFVGWYKDSELISTETEYEVTVSESILLVAVFEHTVHIAGTQWGNDDDTHWHKCTGCDEKLDVSAHSGGTATCTQEAVCSDCGTSYGELAPHDYETTWSQGDANGHWHVCKNCSAHDAAVAHTPGTSESGERICTECGFAFNASGVSVNPVGNVPYTLEGQLITILQDTPCVAGYLAEDNYILMTAITNVDGTHSFLVPEGVTDVLLAVKGDATGDGKLNNTDKTRLNAYLLSKIPLDATALFASDCTGDGKVNNTDKTRMNAVLLGKTTLSW